MKVWKDGRRPTALLDVLVALRQLATQYHIRKVQVEFSDKEVQFQVEMLVGRRGGWVGGWVGECLQGPAGVSR